MMKKLILTIVMLCWIPVNAAVADTQTSTKTKPHSQQASKSHKKTKRKHSTTRHRKRQHLKQASRTHTAHRIYKPNIVTTKTETEVFQEPAKSRFSFVSSIRHSLVGFVHQTVGTLRYSVYKLGGRRFEPKRGIYIVDCSDYVDNILQAVYPHAYSNLVDAAGSEKPTSEHYYNFFNNLSDNSNHYWNRVDDVEDLEPGDILVFRTKNTLGIETGGHVMVVMNRPVQDDDAFLVRVADSAPSAHSQDTRPANASGIGIGNLLLKVNPDTGEPSAYAWKVGARWKHNVNFAMARPVGVY
jgi:Ni/Co efflux regulator RcnB